MACCAGIFFFFFSEGGYNNRISIVEPRSFVTVNGTIIAPFSSLLNNEWERKEMCWYQGFTGESPGAWNTRVKCVLIMGLIGTLSFLSTGFTQQKSMPTIIQFNPIPIAFYLATREGSWILSQLGGATIWSRRQFVTQLQLDNQPSTQTPTPTDH